MAEAICKPRAQKRDDFSSNRHHASSFCLSMICSENRDPLFRIMLGAMTFLRIVITLHRFV
jgi:hypothetical protein